MEEEQQQAEGFSDADFERSYSSATGSEQSTDPAQVDTPVSEDTDGVTHDEGQDGNAPEESSKDSVKEGGDVKDDDKPVEEKASDEVKARNDRNAQRRIRNRNRYQQKISALEQEIENLKKQEKTPVTEARMDSLQGRISDARDEYNAEEYNDFADRVCNSFGEEKGQEALRLIDKYADYVNANEPELLKLVQRPLGDVLLTEWCTRMENRKARNSWMNMTKFEQSQTLSQLYRTIVDKVNSAMAPKAEEKPQVQDVPVAASGRGSAMDHDGNDFEASIQKVLHERGLKKV